MAALDGKHDMSALRWPTLFLVVPAAITLAVAGANAGLIADRSALSGGQLWRLWTGHWVHFSTTHFWWDVGATLLLAGELERRRPGISLRFAVIAAPLISLGALMVRPEMSAYGGLSGLAMGLATLLSTELVRAGDRDRAIGWLLGGLVMAKLGAELARPGIFVTFVDPAFRAEPAAHVIGAILGLIHGKTVGRRRPMPAG